jgi:hypothetical protein
MSLTPRDRLRRLASYYEDQVGRSRADQIAAKAMLRARPLVGHHRVLIAATSIAAAIAVLIGVGAVSDEAHPGQVLYPLDRAYESVAAFVGVNTGPSEERLVEALALLDLGRDLEAVSLVDEALLTIGRDAGVDDWAAASPAASEPATPAQQPVTGRAEVAEPPAGTQETASEPAVVAAEPSDSASSLRLATEYLLQTVRDARKPKEGVPEGEAAGNLRAAASGVVAAAETIKAQAALAAAAEEASTTTTVPGGSTTTTVPDGSTTTTVPDGSTTTTVPDGSTTTTVPDGSTTTTTVPDGSTTTTTVPDSIIVLPPQP